MEAIGRSMYKISYKKTGYRHLKQLMPMWRNVWEKRLKTLDHTGMSVAGIAEKILVDLQETSQFESAYDKTY